MAFEYIPGDDAFHRLDPRVKIVFWLVMIFAITAFTDPIFMVALFVGVLLLVRYAGMPMGKVASILKAIWPILVGWVVICTLYYHPRGSYVMFWAPFLPIFGFGWRVPITVDGLTYAVGVTLKIMCTLLILRMIMVLTPARDLIIGLIKFRLPPEFGMALATGFGFVPVLIKETETIREALESRGWRYNYVNPAQRMKALYTKMLIPSIRGSFRHAADIALAMETRGFSYNIRGRTYVQEVRLRRSDYVAIVLIFALLTIMAVTSRWVLGWGDYTTTVNILRAMFPEYLAGLERLP
jgi:energy-coupling factor transport system permease protein